MVMAVFDTPITTDDRSLNKVLDQPLPVAVFFYDSRENANKPLEDALNNVAREHAGKLLIARVDAARNPAAHQQYGGPRTPALVTLDKTLAGRKVKSQAEHVRPEDVRAHMDYLLGKGPQPVEKKAAPEQPKAGKAGGVMHVTDATFQKAVLESQVPVFVDFWAPWCGPCLSVAPLIDQLAGQYAGRVKIVKLNTDENPVIMRRFQVMSIPTFITFRDGKQVGRRSGASPQYIKELIEEVAR
jgi:thioredoxin 1